MTEEVIEPQEAKTYTAEEVEQMVAGLKNKNSELLGKMNDYKLQVGELSEAQQRAEEERLKQSEEFKTLYEREQKSKAELAEKYEAFSKKIQAKEIESAARTVSTELTRDQSRAALIEQQVQQFARYSDDGVKFEMGGVEIDKSAVIDHIKTKFPFLVDGVDSSAGEANGNKGGKAAQTVTRAQFEQMNQGQRSTFVKGGGKVTD